MVNKGTKLFLLALLPPLEIEGEIISIQKEIGLNYQSVAALNVPPHITVIAPFLCPLSFEQLLIDRLTEIASELFSFHIFLKDFDHFKEHTIFIKPRDNPPGEMEKVFKTFYSRISSEMTFIQELKMFPKYHPHMTVAFKDLKNNFQNAWKEFKERKFEAEFSADKIFLLEHIKGKWEVITGFDFEKRNQREVS